jgi:hypothetical protein
MRISKFWWTVHTTVLAVLTVSIFKVEDDSRFSEQLAPVYKSHVTRQSAVTITDVSSHTVLKPSVLP